MNAVDWDCPVVQVIFAPRIAGVYVAQLSLSSGLVDRGVPAVVGKLPVMVTLQAVAENPSVEVRLNTPGIFRTSLARMPTFP